MGLRLVVTALVALAVAGPSCRPDSVTLDVVTYNIHWAEGTDGRVDLARVAAVLRGAEVIGLQECDRFNPRTGLIDQPAELARRLDLDHAFGETWRTFVTQSGNALLSRYPIVTSRNHRLPRVGESQRRAMLEAELDVEGMPLRVFVTHLSTDRLERDLQLTTVRRIVAGAPGRKILMGDFNARHYSAVIGDLTREYRDCWATATGDGFTYPSSAPTVRIDYIFLDAERVEVQHVTVPAAGPPHPSDHRPVMARMTVRR